jgi:hypothetical protein
MTERQACPPAPGPLEAYAARFDDLFLNLAQRRGFREYLTGLLAPRDRNKTLTCLAGVEPVASAGLASVQRLQYFLSESGWNSDQVNDRRLELLRADPACAPHEAGLLVIDDSGDRKDDTATAHVGRQSLGRLGKTDTSSSTWSSPWSTSTSSNTPPPTASAQLERQYGRPPALLAHRRRSPPRHHSGRLPPPRRRHMT